MNINVSFTCPYCQLEQTHVIEQMDIYAQFHTRYCDNEVGGCDMPLVLKIELKPIVKVFRMEETSGND